MADVELNQSNTAVRRTTLIAAPPTPKSFDGESVLTADAHAPLAFENPALNSQDLEAIHARGLNSGCGVTGEGGDNGPGVVGMSGGLIPHQPSFPHDTNRPPFPGRGRVIGVLGLSNQGQGVAGESVTEAGVFGSSRKASGVVGHAEPGIGKRVRPRAGVSGLSITGTGVDGWSDSGYGVSGISQKSAGVYGKGTGRRIVGRDQISIINSPAALFDGEVVVNGHLTILGAKSAAVPHPDGSHRLLYSIESPESWFEDFGEAKLVKGRGKVRLASDFAATVNTRNYHVFLTAYGDSNGLYVTGRSATGFEVREQNGGTSKIAFSYRIVAKRKDVTARRMQKIKFPKGDK